MEKKEPNNEANTTNVLTEQKHSEHTIENARETAVQSEALRYENADSIYE